MLTVLEKQIIQTQARHLHRSCTSQMLSFLFWNVPSVAQWLHCCLYTASQTYVFLYETSRPCPRHSQLAYSLMMLLSMLHVVGFSSFVCVQTHTAPPPFKPERTNSHRGEYFLGSWLPKQIPHSDNTRWHANMDQGTLIRPNPNKKGLGNTWLLKERETVFSRDKFLIGYPISSSQPKTHILESNTKWTQLAVFIYSYIYV